MHVDGAMQPTQADIQARVQEALQQAGVAQPGTEVIRTPGGTPGGAPGIRIETPQGQVISLDPATIQAAITGMTAPPPPPPRDMGPPDSIVAIIIISILASTAVLFPIARALGRRLDGKPKPALPTSDVTTRLDRIENAVESIAVEVERISEGQRFTTRLLSDRQADPLLVPRGGSDVR
jgi:hypothetical protein